MDPNMVSDSSCFHPLGDGHHLSSLAMHCPDGASVGHRYQYRHCHRLAAESFQLAQTDQPVVNRRTIRAAPVLTPGWKEA
jgi:hypothetical protein